MENTKFVELFHAWRFRMQKNAFRLKGTGENPENGQIRLLLDHQLVFFANIKTKPVIFTVKTYSHLTTVCQAAKQ